MTQPSDEQLNSRIAAYLRGELTGEEVNLLRSELEQNETFAGQLELLLLGPPPGESEKPEHGGMPIAMQSNIIRRSKLQSRFSVVSITFTTLAAIFLVSVLYGYSNVFFATRWFGPDAHAMIRVTSDVISFTKPGIKVGNSATGSALLTFTSDYELREQVGRGENTVGYYRENWFFAKVSSRYDWSGGQHALPFFFRYPAEGTDLAPQPSSGNGWLTLEKLPEGTVSQLAVSFRHLLTHDEYFAIIKKYDLDTIWFAVDTGVESKLSASNPFLGSGLVFGYAPDALPYGDEDNPGSYTIEDNAEGERRAQTYLREIRYLLDHGRLTEALLRNNAQNPQFKAANLEDRYSYLMKNGVKLYGAVLTGPTKELLKLKQESELDTPLVGSTDWWNWDQQQASGVEYSH
ncbi:anti sigma factor C-terminal domain-containing protein [Paenibacillus sepulcri]